LFRHQKGESDGRNFGGDFFQVTIDEDP